VQCKPWKMKGISLMSETGQLELIATEAEVEVAEAEVTAELLDLYEHERVIEQGMATFIDVGWALMKIRDGEKYRAAGYKDFGAYVSKRWGLSRRTAYNRIDAAEMASLVAPTEDKVQPVQQEQMLMLTGLKDDPDGAQQAWTAALQASEGKQPTPAQVRSAVEAVTGEPYRIERTQTEPESGVSHPAPFSKAVLHAIADLVEGFERVLDPFAGIGRIHELAEQGHDTAGVEIEKEWAEQHERTQQGNALRLKFTDGSFDAIATSPTYGNRLADGYEASDPEGRSSYRFDLGRELHKENAGALQWGPKYRTFHEKAWREADRVLRPGGRLVLNIKDHIREGKWQDVTAWHTQAFIDMGYRVAAIRPVKGSRGMRRGDNYERADAEMVIAFDKPEVMRDAG
jgi:SAM-dependent methyltransferase